MSEADEAFIGYETERNFGLHPGSSEAVRKAKRMFLTGEPDPDLDEDDIEFYDEDDDSDLDQCEIDDGDADDDD